MKIVDVAQGSLEWLQARAGVITASEMDALITPKFAIKKGSGPDTYLARKLAERWVGGSIANFQSIDMELGQILEGEAIPFLELSYNLTVQRVGLVLTDCGRVGASPDGLLGDNSGVEIKCPLPHTHCSYILDGVVPDEYLVQVHASLFVTERTSWKFLSYCRRFPALMLAVERDETKIAVIREATQAFLERYDAAFKRMCEFNGGPPRNYFARTAAPYQKPTEPINELEVVP